MKHLTLFEDFNKKTNVEELGLYSIYKKLVELGYKKDNNRISRNKERYLRKLHNLFEYYHIWGGSYNDITDKEKLIELMEKINLFISAYDIKEIKPIEIDKINFDRFNFK